MNFDGILRVFRLFSGQIHAFYRVFLRLEIEKIP